jgi:plastocyanin
MKEQLTHAQNMFEKLPAKVRSRKVGLVLLWILFICAGAGTYKLSRTIELNANNSASVFMSNGTTHEISLYVDKVQPAEVRVHVGEEVVFVTKDTSRHNIAEERTRKTDARLESGEFGGEESYSLVFQNKGSMSFYDRLNQDLRITVVIE